jgi:sterol desaturase/sphingolipid hydroxylase (fatty acid hydroxylase superfamily)
MVATSVFAFVVADLVAYWTHRAEHRSRYTWRFHSVHHSPPQLDWLAGRRFHPLDVVVEQILPVGVVAVLGVPLADLAPYLFATGVVTLLAHSNVAVPGRWLARVVVTPGYHRSHHERGRDGSNFALVLPVMDVLFGTASFQAGERSFGTNAAVPENGFVALLKWGFGLSVPAQRVSTSNPAQNDRALAT